VNVTQDTPVTAERPISLPDARARGGAGRALRISRPLALGLASILGGLIVWEIGARIFSQPFVLPTVADTAAKALRLSITGELLTHIRASYLRILIGFAMGSVAGAVIGMAMGSVIHIRRLFEPLVNFFRFIPPIAWLAPVLIWFGVGEIGKILLIIYTTSFVVLLNALVGVSSVPRNRIRAARCFGASPLQVFKWVLLPSAVPYILTGMSIALTNSFATIVTAEMLAAQSGLGYLILVSRNYMATDKIFVGIVTLGVLGLMTSRAFDVGLHRCAWRYHLQK